MSWGGAGEVLARWIADEGHCPGPAPDGNVSSSLPACADPGPSPCRAATATPDRPCPRTTAERRWPKRSRGWATRPRRSATTTSTSDARSSRTTGSARGSTTWRRTSRSTTPASVATSDWRPSRFRAPRDQDWRRRPVDRHDAHRSEAEQLRRALVRRRGAGAGRRDWPGLGGRTGRARVLAHECADRLTPIFERHPEWRVAFVGAAHCHRVIHDTSARCRYFSWLEAAALPPRALARRSGARPEEPHRRRDRRDLT